MEQGNRCHISGMAAATAFRVQQRVLVLARRSLESMLVPIELFAPTSCITRVGVCMGLPVPT